MGARTHGVVLTGTSDSDSPVFAGNCPRCAVVPAASDIGPDVRAKSSSTGTEQCHNLLPGPCAYFIQRMNELMKICNPSLETGLGTLDPFCPQLSLQADSPCLGGQGGKLGQFKCKVLHH